MQISKDEIKSVQTIGNLNGSDVKIITTKGGFHMGVGKSKKNGKDDVIAAGSHPAIVAYQIRKNFGFKFEENMTKSERENMPSVTDYSHLLPSQLYDSGVNLYALKKNFEVEFKITKYVNDICSVKATSTSGELSLNKYEGLKTSNQLVKSELSKCLQNAIKEEAEKSGLIIKNNME